MYGGTDGQLWYSDTWCFDPVTNLWTQLNCSGFIPTPSEGHAATVVNDIMYVFGGRSSKGDDLGVLSALKLSSKRWFTFENMGQAPAPRSGHSMTAYSSHKVLVMGGESHDQDDTHVYVLDTSRIKYPPKASAGDVGDTSVQSISSLSSQNAPQPGIQPGQSGLQSGRQSPAMQSQSYSQTGPHPQPLELYLFLEWWVPALWTDLSIGLLPRLVRLPRLTWTDPLVPTMPVLTDLSVQSTTRSTIGDTCNPGRLTTLPPDLVPRPTDTVWLLVLPVLLLVWLVLLLVWLAPTICPTEHPTSALTRRSLSLPTMADLSLLRPRLMLKMCTDLPQERFLLLGPRR